MPVIITPVANRVFIKLEKFGDTTKSGLKIVREGQQWQENTVLAEIMAKNEADKEIEVGQVVIIRGDAGRWIDPELVEDNEFVYRIIDKEEIIAVVTQKPVEVGVV